MGSRLPVRGVPPARVRAGRTRPSRLLQALGLTEAFGWEYHRASTLIALAQNRVDAVGSLDAVAEQWLAQAEELCAIHGLAS